MSSDKFIKMRIKQMILNEKVAQFGAGRGRSGADIGYDMNVRDGWRGHGQDPFLHVHRLMQMQLVMLLATSPLL